MPNVKRTVKLKHFVVVGPKVIKKNKMQTDTKLIIIPPSSAVASIFIFTEIHFSILYRNTLKTLSKNNNRLNP